jgi:hypothetical protein
MGGIRKADVDLAAKIDKDWRTQGKQTMNTAKRHTHTKAQNRVQFIYTMVQNRVFIRQHHYQIRIPRRFLGILKLISYTIHQF